MQQVETAETKESAATKPRPDNSGDLERELNALAARVRRAGFIEAGHFIGVVVASIEESRRT